VRTSYLVLIFFVFATLNACGGGGGGNQPAITPPLIGAGGVTLSAPVGGNDFLDDIYTQPSGTLSGGKTIVSNATGTQISWINKPGNAAILNYTASGDWIYFTFNGLATVVCGVSAIYKSSPVCSDLGITIDRVAGKITFKMSPLMTDINAPHIFASGALHFTPY